MLDTVVEIIIAVVAVVISAALLPWLKTKATTAETQQLLDAVERAVVAAEQTYKSAGSGHGVEKLELVKSSLLSSGVEITQSVLDMIEHTVWEKFNSTVNK